MSEQEQSDEHAEERAMRVAAIAFALAILAGLGLLAVYVSGGQPQLEGILLFVAFGGVGVGLGVWSRFLLSEQELVEERLSMASADEERTAFAAAYRDSLGETTDPRRRRFLTRLLAGAAASIGLALLAPVRSFGPGPRNDLFFTAWERGRRLVTPADRPLRPADIAVDQMITVFPEGAIGQADAQAALIRTRPGALQLGVGAPPTVDDLVVYSKVCTHAGCPVGLYRARAAELLCPCHQSTFDVLRGARVLSGPAGRPLPQLPLGIDEEGFLIALGDFEEPVGPTFWNVTHERQDPS